MWHHVSPLASKQCCICSISGGAIGRCSTPSVKTATHKHALPMEAFLFWSECGTFVSLTLLTLLSLSSLTMEFILSHLCYCHEEGGLGDSTKPCPIPRPFCLALRNVKELFEGDGISFCFIL